MIIHNAIIEGRPLQYSLAKALHIHVAGERPSIIPHRNGDISMAICRECGLAVIGNDDADSAQLLMSTLGDRQHRHWMLSSVPRVQFDPAVIDYLYEVYDPEGAVA